MENKFTINAQTCTLKYNSQENGSIILNPEVKYRIPIYQRPYSWSDEQISKFISDIFQTYWGNDSIVIKEPLFIGTMQLTVLDNNEHQIIDGQQRLTTFLVLLRVLEHIYPECEELKTINYNWLTTDVSSGKQQEYLDEFIRAKDFNIINNLNNYAVNASKIKEYILEEISEENSSFDSNDFVNYLLSNIYFVVIETRAGLTKTLQIFNSINTTGLDLNGGDIFKIKMYEYLTSIKGEKENVFEEISALYKKIDDNNAELKYHYSDINDILRIYQYILIARHELPNTLYSIGANTFFERLFDTIFNTFQWEHFKNNTSRVKLSIEDLNKIINLRYEWQKTEYSSVEDACLMYFIWWSRYSKYWILNFVFLFKFKDEEGYWNKLQIFNRQLSKLYFIYSIRFLKAVNEIHTFTYSLLKTISDKSYDEVIKLINERIGKLEKHKGWYDLEHILYGDITYNSKTKNLICRLSAMLDEEYLSTDKEKINNIREKLFDSPIDIEHIQSYHDKDGNLRQVIWDEWGKEINSVGNLMVLEQKINRSISNNGYSSKLSQYQLSQFNIVKNQSKSYKEWSLEECKERKQSEVTKIIDYLFN